MKSSGEYDSFSAPFAVLVENENSPTPYVTATKDDMFDKRCYYLIHISVICRKIMQTTEIARIAKVGGKSVR
jgi:hypothetical protein